MRDPSTRSVISTTLNFYEDIALGLNWYGLYVREGRKFKAINAMNDLLDMIDGDEGDRIKLDPKDLAKFRALYWDGVYLVELWKSDGVLAVPEKYAIAYNYYKGKIEYKVGEKTEIYKGMVMQLDRRVAPLPANAEVKKLMGFYYLNPRNPVRSKAGIFTTFVMIHKPVPLRDGWAGYDKLQVIKNCGFYLNKFDPVTHMIVETPVAIDFETNNSNLVSTDWHDKMTTILWRELSQVCGRIKVKITDQLQGKEIDEEKLARIMALTAGSITKMVMEGEEETQKKEGEANKEG